MLASPSESHVLESARGESPAAPGGLPQASLAAELDRARNDLQRFCDIADHELQEPLQTVMACAQLLAGCRPGDAVEAAELVRQIRGAVCRMRDALEELRDYAGVDARQQVPETLELSPILAAAVAALEAKIACVGATVSHGPLPALPVYGVWMARVFEALVEHALDRSDARPATVHVAARRGLHAWVFSVSYRAAAGDLAGGQDAFALLKLPRRPDGFTSLATARRIVEAHGGSLWHESTGSNSMFLFTIPAFAAPTLKTAHGAA